MSAWEFEPELEIANCFVEARTEIEFFDSTCCVQSNLPIPKQNEVYYLEAKIYEKAESSLISIGLSTKPYPLFRLPGISFPCLESLLILGWHKCSVAYTSSGDRRFNQPFLPIPYGPEYVRGDVIGVGYRPRTGSVFFTRNGKKLDDVAHGLKTQNLFPTVGASGPCSVHVNFGQSGFVFIEANVKKWGLAPMTGTLAPPPPYGSEQGSVLLDASRNTSRIAHSFFDSQPLRHPNSPGPERSPTDISLAHLAYNQRISDLGEGTSVAPFGSMTLQQASQMLPPPPKYSRSGHHEGKDLPSPTPSYDTAVGHTDSRET